MRFSDIPARSSQTIASKCVCKLDFFSDGYGARVQFDEQGNAPGRYTIMNYQRNRTTHEFEYRVVGTWADGHLSLDLDSIVWADGTVNIPRSENILSPGIFCSFMHSFTLRFLFFFFFFFFCQPSRCGTGDFPLVNSSGNLYKFTGTITQIDSSSYLLSCLFTCLCF